MLRSTLFVALLAASACGSSNPATPRPVELDTEVTLARGDSAAVADKDLTVQFLEVTEDSRCPLDATCVWAGEVKVRLALSRGTEEPTRPEVREGDAAALGPYRVVLVKVMPYPTSTGRPRADEYRATLKVTADQP
jgi:hypothetical protein